MVYDGLKKRRWEKLYEERAGLHQHRNQTCGLSIAPSIKEVLF